MKKNIKRYVMKKNIKQIAVVTLIVVVSTLMLAGCGKSDFYGTWKLYSISDDTQEISGSQLKDNSFGGVSLKLNEDGTFKFLQKFNKYSDYLSGKWTLNDNGKIKLKWKDPYTSEKDSMTLTPNNDKNELTSSKSDLLEYDYVLTFKK